MSPPPTDADAASAGQVALLAQLVAAMSADLREVKGQTETQTQMLVGLTKLQGEISHHREMIDSLRGTAERQTDRLATVQTEVTVLNRRNKAIALLLSLSAAFVLYGVQEVRGSYQAMSNSEQQHDNRLTILELLVNSKQIEHAFNRPPAVAGSK